MLFTKRKQKPAPQPTDPLSGVNYNTVVEWLVGLSTADHLMVLRSAKIYRKADREVAKTLGIKNEPVTFIHPPKPIDIGDELDLLDDLPVTKSKKAKS